MASPGRRSARDLNDELRADAPRFRFFQAVRLLALCAGKMPGPAAIPAALRFRSPLSLDFPPSEIAAVERCVGFTRPGDAQTDEALAMTVAFMGLTGPSGALPVAYTELLIDRRNRFRDVAAHRFLDLFTHRAVSLFYTAWRKHRFYLAFESGSGDHFSRNLLDLVGVGLRRLQQRLQASDGAIPDRVLTYYAGLLAKRPVAAVNVAAIVSGYFGVAAQLEQFVGHWLHVPRHEQSALDGRPCRLGVEAFSGERLWDRQNALRLRLGPLGAAEFADFMPGRPGLGALRQLVRFCLGLAFNCELVLVLRRDDVPLARIAATAPSAPRLGYNVWLNSSAAPGDADDVRFALLRGD